MTNMQLKES